MIYAIALFYAAIAVIWCAYATKASEDAGHEASGPALFLVGVLWPVTLPLAFALAWYQIRTVKKKIREYNKTMDGWRAVRDKARAEFNGGGKLTVHEHGDEIPFDMSSGGRVYDHKIQSPEEIQRRATELLAHLMREDTPPKVSLEKKLMGGHTSDWSDVSDDDSEWDKFWSGS